MRYVTKADLIISVISIKLLKNIRRKVLLNTEKSLKILLNKTFKSYKKTPENQFSGVCIFMKLNLKLFKIYISILLAFFTPSTKASTSSKVLYTAKLALTVPAILKNSIIGCVQ